MATLIKDAEIQGLISPLTVEERQQLEANLLAEGCRDHLAVWPQPHGPPILLDGHHRFDLCTTHGIPYETTALAWITSREEAINWVIANQLGRRNLTEQYKSYLRGKRYNLEKRHDEGHGDQKSGGQNVRPNVATTLADEYGVDEKTIRRDGAFAEATDTLEQRVREDIRQVVTQRHSEEEQGRVTKQQVTQAGKAVKAGRVEPQPFMRRADWKDYQVIEAIMLLDGLTSAEQEAIASLLDRPHIPAEIGLQIVRNLAEATPQYRQQIDQLQRSADPREQSMAMTLAARKAPEPDPQVLIARRLINALADIRQRQRSWATRYPREPWTAQLKAMDSQLQAIQYRWQEIATHAEQVHQQRIASYATVEGA